MIQIHLAPRVLKKITHPFYRKEKQSEVMTSWWENPWRRRWKRKKGIKLVYKAAIKTMIDEDYSRLPRKTLSNEMNRFIGRSCLKGMRAGEKGETRRETPVIVIIFSGGWIYATHRLVSVHKTHLKFSRQPERWLLSPSIEHVAGRGAPRGL